MHQAPPPRRGVRVHRAPAGARRLVVLAVVLAVVLVVVLAVALEVELAVVLAVVLAEQEGPPRSRCRGAPRGCGGRAWPSRAWCRRSRPGGDLFVVIEKQMLFIVF